MTHHTAYELPAKSVSEVLNAAVSFSRKLDVAGGEKLSGTPTVVELDTADLIIGTPQISTGVLEISDVDVPAGEAIQFNVSGGVADTTYILMIQCSTNSSPPQTLVGRITFLVEVD